MHQQPNLPNAQLEELKTSLAELKTTCTDGFKDAVTATGKTTTAIVDLTTATDEYNRSAAQINAEVLIQLKKLNGSQKVIRQDRTKRTAAASP